MEIERDVTIENGGNLEVGFQVGLRTAAALPDYSDQELKQALGDLSNRIQQLFRNPAPKSGEGSSGGPQYGP